MELSPPDKMKTTLCPMSAAAVLLATVVVLVSGETIEVLDNACAQLQLTAQDRREPLSELCATAEHSCTAAFASGGQGRRSCMQVCEDAGLRCAAAYDDAFDDGRCPAGTSIECDRRLHSKVFMSQRALSASPAAPSLCGVYLSENGSLHLCVRSHPDFASPGVRVPAP